MFKPHTTNYPSSSPPERVGEDGNERAQSSAHLTSKSHSTPIPELPWSPRPSQQHAPPLEIQTLEREEEDGLKGADSPRTAVARKLGEMNLKLAVRSIAMPVLDFGRKDPGPKTKKPKLDSPERAIDPANQRAGSPLKQTHLSGIPWPKDTFDGPSSSPEDASAFYWNDDEITGHLGMDPDDDGYGINGIGFRPTAAMAAARSLKRRRQVDEWKTRELREERRRRAEGRRGARSVAEGSGGMGEKRVVRFA